MWGVLCQLKNIFKGPNNELSSGLDSGLDKPAIKDILGDYG